jgi:hypothetical protein
MRSLEPNEASTSGRGGGEVVRTRVNKTVKENNVNTEWAKGMIAK